MLGRLRRKSAVRDAGSNLRCDALQVEVVASAKQVPSLALECAFAPETGLVLSFSDSRSLPMPVEPE